MFNWFKPLFEKDYDFSQWDNGNFPLGMPTIDGASGMAETVIRDVRPFKVSPMTMYLLGGAVDGTAWTNILVVDEEIKPSQPTGAAMSNKAMWRVLRHHGIVSERGA